MRKQLQERDATLLRMEKQLSRLSGQSFSFNIPREIASESILSSQSRDLSEIKTRYIRQNVLLGEFLVQFRLIARTNNWDYSTKELILASCLRGKARAILEGGTELEDLCFYELVSRLELQGKPFNGDFLYTIYE